MHYSLCPPASWRPVFVIHCLNVDFSLSSLPAAFSLPPSLLSPLPPPLLTHLFLSAVCSCLLCGMLFINLTTVTVYNSRKHWHYSVLFDDILVSCCGVCVRACVFMCVFASEKMKERLLTVLCVSVLQVWCVWSQALQLWSLWCCSVLRLVTPHLSSLSSHIRSTLSPLF